MLPPPAADDTGLAARPEVVLAAGVAGGHRDGPEGCR